MLGVIPVGVGKSACVARIEILSAVRGGEVSFICDDLIPIGASAEAVIEEAMQRSHHKAHLHVMTLGKCDQPRKVYWLTSTYGEVPELRRQIDTFGRWSGRHLRGR